MVNQLAATATHASTGEVVATGVSFEDYMEHYAADYCEWVKGVVIKMSPLDWRHHEIVVYLMILLRVYFRFNPIGKVVGQPFVMKLSSESTGREPDLQVILSTNPGQFTRTAMLGPADLCIEVVSPDSVGRDYGEKFVEYEKGGVREYWILDPLRRAAIFRRLDENGLYVWYEPDAQGNYHTPLLPQLALHVPTLWQDPLPDVVQVVETMRAMLAG